MDELKNILISIICPATKEILVMIFKRFLDKKDK